MRRRQWIVSVDVGSRKPVPTRLSPCDPRDRKGGWFSRDLLWVGIPTKADSPEAELFLEKEEEEERKDPYVGVSLTETPTGPNVSGSPGSWKATGVSRYPRFWVVVFPSMGDGQSPCPGSMWNYHAALIPATHQFLFPRRFPVARRRGRDADPSPLTDEPPVPGVNVLLDRSPAVQGAERRERSRRPGRS